MTFGERVKILRREMGLSQEALGAQGFVSTPGWIKIENGQRQASEKLIEKLLKWLVGDKHMKAGAATGLREELLSLKYMGSNSAFVREMAKDHARNSANGALLAATEDTSTYKTKAKAKARPKAAAPAPKPAAKSKPSARAAKKRR